MEDTALASELDRLQAMARELKASVVDKNTPAAARELCGELAASVDRAVRLAGSNGNAGSGRNSGQPRNSSRKSTAAAKVRKQVRVASAQDTAPLDDGLSWRKYGQKDILGAPYPRAYFRCTHRHTRGCQATKQVQRAAADPLLFDVVYHGDHTCAQAPALSLLSAEQQHGFGQEEQDSPAAAPEGILQFPLEPVTPPGAIDGWTSPAGSWYQHAGSYGYAAGAGLGTDMDFEAQLDEFLNPTKFFQPEIHSL
ncbi:transcription factor WRKY19-like [Lolium rigidum]|uniref:transcription factor WRKY19-like n=1 Tax=Lolium rigidum TaxID=89674 RepID=UPI001F5CCFFC|nr:transcription factor WRKY19-like [Lolium rigidum]